MSLGADEYGATVLLPLRHPNGVAPESWFDGLLLNVLYFTMFTLSNLYHILKNNAIHDYYTQIQYSEIGIEALHIPFVFLNL